MTALLTLQGVGLANSTSSHRLWVYVYLDSVHSKILSMG